MMHTRVVRQFGEHEPILFLEKSVWLASSPTSGTRLDLTEESVAVPLEIVTVILSPHPDRPGVQAPAMELHNRVGPPGRCSDGAGARLARPRAADDGTLTAFPTRLGRPPARRK